jgi:protocatechuate 3,4-dioxygenase beta subunit
MTRRTMLHVSLGAGAGVLGTGFLPGPPSDPECATPAQDEGPFFPRRDQPDKDVDLTRIRGRSDRAEGDVIAISGQVLDDELRPIAGALVDIWQANRHGRYAHEDDPNPAPLDPAFQGWGQVRTDAEGRYSFTTIIPGAYPAGDGWTRPPHIHFKVARRGYHELVTQMYFAGQSLNDADRILMAVPEEDRKRLVVTLVEGAPHDYPPRRGTFNIVLQRVARG